MSAGRRSKNATYAPNWKPFAALTAVNCIAESPDGATCAWKVVLLSAGDLTLLKDADGVDRPITGCPAGFEHEADVSAVTCSAPFVVYF